MARRSRRGFTLLELLAAVAISGLAMLGGVLLLDQVSDSTARIVRTGYVVAQNGNGPRVLRQMLLDARVTADSLDRFRGDERSLEVTTLCRRPGGWFERCRLSLGVDWRTDSSVLMASTSLGDNLELARDSGRVELRYFDTAKPDSAWLERWALSIAMPGALGVVRGGDTTVYPMGPARD